MSDYKFQKLTPTSDVKLNAYKEAFDFVFANEDLKNVAISGAYSAGKSSVIESYKKLHPSKRYIHISLACFKPVEFNEKTEMSDVEQTASPINENVLEGKILNQLVHQINANKIPQTNFRIKRQISRLLTTVVALCLFLFGGSLFYILNFDNWQKYVNDLKIAWLKNALSWTTNSALMLLFALVMAAIGVLFVYNIIQLQKNKNLLKKVSVQGNGIEIFEHCDDSYFDKYLNEVIYLFENSGADVIVFEDMDRYEVNQIFQRLRDINTIVNNRRQMQQRRFSRIRKLLKIKNRAPLRFFYLLRDDIFVSKDRTKFFDFLIPIVPILDGSNSYDQFIAHFKDGEILKLFDSSFLQGISLYVDDMRILKNIYNEFRIYYERIGTTEQNPNKLLALIVYKNIFPRDFGDLQLNKGFVFTLFAKKGEHISAENNAMESKISLLNTKIDVANKEVFKSEAELTEYYNNLKIQYVSGTARDRLRQELEERKQAIRDREDIEKFKQEVSIIETEIAALQTKKLHEIITRENIDVIFQAEYENEIGKINHFNEIKSSEYFPLLKYLLRYGFIDETYPDYMTYFYENSLSRIDKVFLRSVTDKIAKEFTYELKDPEMVVRRLSITDLDNIETLNFDLLAFLLKNKDKYPDHLRHLILQLKDTVKFDFIEKFFASGKVTELFICYINNCWPQLFDEIHTQSHFSDSLKKQFALSVIYYTSNDDLLLVDTNGVLSGFISNSADFLRVEDPKVNRIIEVFRLINLKFKAIDFTISNSGLWNAVYSNDMYDINNKMLDTILENQYSISKTEDFKHKNYTLVLSKPKERLKTYVQENIERYAEVMLSNCGKSIMDNEETIACFLNDESICDETKSTYIEYLQSDISTLGEIDDSQWWPVLINKRRLAYSDTNVLCYFFGLESKLDDVLIGFINDCGKDFTFDFNAIDNEYGENCGSAFWIAILQCNELDDIKYKLIIKSLHRVYNSFSATGISKDKIDILIDLKVIRMSTGSLAFMRASYPDNIIRFINTNIDVYTESVIDASNFMIAEMLEVLHLDVADKYKIKLLSLTTDPISIANQKFSAAVVAHILKNNFDMRDLQYIVQRYQDLHEPAKAITEDLATNHINDVISKKYVLSWPLLVSLLSRSSIEATNKLRLFAQTLNSLDEAKCKSCLLKLVQNDFLSLFEGKRPKFEKNETNEIILNVFKDKKWITKFEEETSTSYRAYGRKRH